MSDNNKTSDFKTGAVRSADANHLDFTSLPIVGLIAVARTSSEGGTKYDRYNYMQGMPVHDTLNHSLRHIYMFLMGDRSEPHLEHATWGLMASVQQNLLDPGLSEPHLLGPGATITPVMQAYMDSRKDDLAARRKAGEFAHIGEWSLRDLPEIQTILRQRDEWEAREENADIPRKPWSEVVNGIIKEYVRTRETDILSKSAIVRLSKIRDTSAMVFDNAQGQAVAGDEEPYSGDAKYVVDPNVVGVRFRVEHPTTRETRITHGLIYKGGSLCDDQSPEWDMVLFYGDDPEDQFALSSPDYAHYRILAIYKDAWDSGKPCVIDSNWGYASASARCSKITGEVTRTEYATESDIGDPLPDEDYHHFIGAGVRVYFKKS